MIKTHTLIIWILFLSLNCLAQRSEVKTYVIRDLMGGFTYIVDSDGRELAALNSNEYYIRDNHIVDFFHKKEHNILLKRKSDLKLFSVDKNGKIEALPSFIEDVVSYRNNSVLYYTKDKLVLSDLQYNELKFIDKPYSFRSKGVGVFIVQEQEDSELQMWNSELIPIHDLNVSSRDKVYNYEEGWVLAITPNDDRLLYHISGKMMNVSKLLLDNFGIEKNNDNRIGVHMASDGIFRVKVGAAYFKLYYLNTKGEFIWSSELKDIKSASPFEKGVAKIERYDTSFDEFLESKDRSKGRSQCSFHTIFIDTNGGLIDTLLTTNHTSSSHQNVWDGEIVEEAYPSEIYYTDSERSLVQSTITRTKRHIALIDRKGNVFWENFSRD